MTPEERVQDFNASVAIGEEVAFKDILPDGFPRKTRTLTPAQIRNGEPVIRLESQDDFVHLDHVLKIPPVTEEMRSWLRDFAQEIQRSLDQGYREIKAKKEKDTHGHQG